MKVYSNTRNHRKTMVLNQTVKNNLETLSQLLRNQTSQSLSLSSSLQSLDNETEARSLARQFVSALNDPCRAMLLYPLILDSSCTYQVDQIFNQTTFPSEVHPLLSLYFHKDSGYSLLESEGRRVVDLFYYFLINQNPQLLQNWLLKRESQSLGEWFFNECIAGFFQLIYKDKQSFTIFMTHFLREGLAYLLVASLSSLQDDNPPEVNADQLERIRYSYLIKFGFMNK